MTTLESNKPYTKLDSKGNIAATSKIMSKSEVEVIDKLRAAENKVTML